MFAKFHQDARRWVEPSKIASPSELTWGLLLKLLYRHMSLRAMAWYRLSCWCKEKRIPAACGLIERWLFFRFGLEIWGDIGGGLYIAHPIGCVIAVESMGENCSVIASATFGMRNEYAFPVIGNNVFVGAGARVLGGISVADNAKVGANAVVTRDVPEGVTVVGIPAKPLLEEPITQSAGIPNSAQPKSEIQSAEPSSESPEQALLPGNKSRNGQVL